ncbi:hypothetical protein HHI36_014744 [Cryptolaemus montrouzieri]|uniref:Reverse transcriptase domain-containing protein n=1 Tax=Cryptolaemus montrouzieri TaxID=559131 RepID=A0ABD2N4H9_9CUCU
MTSLDVISLFSNIQSNTVKKVLKTCWPNIQAHSTIYQKPFFTILDSTFANNYFCADGQFYKQILGSPMGATLSPILDQYVMDDLIRTCNEKPIISSISSPTSNIAQVLTDILTMAYDKNNDFYVKDPYYFSSLIYEVKS